MLQHIGRWAFLIAVGSAVLTWGEAQTNLEYQNRADRYEGVRPKPVSGYDIEVISVLADHQESEATLPDQLRVRFYLVKQTDVYLTVREQDFRLFYWLDKVKPRKEWESRAHNEFIWSTGTVLKQLSGGLQTRELGVLIRLRKPTPSTVEDVAPALLYSAALPQRIDAYVFTLKSNNDAKLSCSVFKEALREPIMTQNFRRVPGGRPFVIHWSARGEPDADYKLVCEGFFIGSNQRVEQTVRFYHKSGVR